MDINFCHLLSYDPGDSFVHWCHCFGGGADDASGVGGAAVAGDVAVAVAVAVAIAAVVVAVAASAASAAVADAVTQMTAD